MAITITRDQLAKFLPDNDTIRRFEKLFLQAGETTPENIDIIFRLIEEVVLGAGSAGASASQANASIEIIAKALELLAAAPPDQPAIPPDDLSPPIQIGTMGEQQADRAKITGGTIDGTTIGGTTPAAVSATILSSTTTTTVGTLLDISAAGAGQIKFPATQNPSANANTLDDYEEGTWTPVFTCATPGNLAVTYSVQAAAYTKIGRQVFANFVISASAFTWTTSSGAVTITGIPFNSAATSQIAGVLDWGGFTRAGYTSVCCGLVTATPAINLVTSGSGVARAIVNIADFPSGGNLFLSGQISYFV